MCKITGKRWKVKCKGFDSCEELVFLVAHCNLFRLKVTGSIHGVAPKFVLIISKLPFLTL